MKKEKHKEEQENTVAEEKVAPDPLAELQAQLAVKEAEAAANWDKFVRERADL